MIWGYFLAYIPLFIHSLANKSKGLFHNTRTGLPFAEGKEADIARFFTTPPEEWHEEERARSLINNRTAYLYFADDGNAPSSIDCVKCMEQVLSASEKQESDTCKCWPCSMSLTDDPERIIEHILKFLKNSCNAPSTKNTKSDPVDPPMQRKFKSVKHVEDYLESDGADDDKEKSSQISLLTEEPEIGTSLKNSYDQDSDSDDETNNSDQEMMTYQRKNFQDLPENRNMYSRQNAKPEMANRFNPLPGGRNSASRNSLQSTNKPTAIGESGEKDKPLKQRVTTVFNDLLSKMKSMRKPKEFEPKKPESTYDPIGHFQKSGGTTIPKRKFQDFFKNKYQRPTYNISSKRNYKDGSYKKIYTGGRRFETVKNLNPKENAESLTQKEQKYAEADAMESLKKAIEDISEETDTHHIRLENVAKRTGILPEIESLVLEEDDEKETSNQSKNANKKLNDDLSKYANWASDSTFSDEEESDEVSESKHRNDENGFAMAEAVAHKITSTTSTESDEIDTTTMTTVTESDNSETKNTPHEKEETHSTTPSDEPETDSTQKKKENVRSGNSEDKTLTSTSTPDYDESSTTITAGTDAVHSTTTTESNDEDETTTNLTVTEEAKPSKRKNKLRNMTPFNGDTTTESAEEVTSQNPEMSSDSIITTQSPTTSTTSESESEDGDNTEQTAIVTTTESGTTPTVGQRNNADDHERSSDLVEEGEERQATGKKIIKNEKIPKSEETVMGNAEDTQGTSTSLKSAKTNDKTSTNNTATSEKKSKYLIEIEEHPVEKSSPEGPMARFQVKVFGDASGSSAFNFLSRLMSNSVDMTVKKPERHRRSSIILQARSLQDPEYLKNDYPKPRSTRNIHPSWTRYFA